MTTIANALTSLGVDEWVLRGEPTTEEEFNNMFRKVIGKDENNSAIESSNPKDFTVTWKQVSDEKKKLAEATGGTFYHWDSRKELANIINKKVQKSVVNKRIVLKQAIGMFFFLIILVSIDWILRRRLGLL